MSESHTDPVGRRRSVLDDAIDRAVRRMVQVEGPPGLRRRVEARITTAPLASSAPWFRYVAVAAAIALLVLAAGVRLRRNDAPVPQSVERRVESQPAPQAAPPSPAPEPAPSSATAVEPGVVAQTRRQPSRVPHADVIRMPKIENVFGDAAGTVAAASVPEADGVRIAALPEATPAADPMSVSALSIAPLTAGATATPPAAGQKSSSAPSPDVKPRPGPPATGVRRRNVNIEVAITEQTGLADPVKKVVAMVVADGQTGSVRSTGSAVEPAAGAVGAPEVVVEARPLTLNIDASPTVRGDDSVQLSLTLEYAPRPDDADKKSARAQLNQRVALTLESGKPMVISRSADPGSSRHITVEVTATVMK